MAYVSKKSSCLQGEFIDVGLSLYETEAAIQAVGGFAFGARGEVDTGCTMGLGFGHKVGNELASVAATTTSLTHNDIFNPGFGTGDEGIEGKRGHAAKLGAFVVQHIESYVGARHNLAQGFGAERGGFGRELGQQGIDLGGGVVGHVVGTEGGDVGGVEHIEQLTDGALQQGMPGFGGYFGQWLKHKAAFGQVLVGQTELWGVDDEVGCLGCFGVSASRMSMSMMRSV